MYLSNVPNSSCTSRKRRALLTAAVILSRLRMMPSSLSNRSIRFSVKRATFSGSNSANARRYASRFRSTIEPAQPGLGAFERQELELLAVVVDRDAPLLVVVGGHQLAAARAPIAAWFSASSCIVIAR